MRHLWPLLIILGACRNSGPLPEQTKAGPPPKPSVQDVVIDKDRQPTEVKDIEILSFKVSVDTVIVQVQYSGGCKPHSFMLYSNLQWMKSLPPKVYVWLEHYVENGPDPCREMEQETLKFRINSLRYEGQDRITLLLYSTDRSALYEYGVKRMK